MCKFYQILLLPHLAIIMAFRSLSCIIGNTTRIYHAWQFFLCSLTDLPTSATRIVLETLKALPPDRKCFRMINGVLVERTVQDVRPALVTNSDGLKKVLNDLLKQYKRQEEDMEKWKASFFLYCFLSILHVAFLQTHHLSLARQAIDFLSFWFFLSLSK